MPKKERSLLPHHSNADLLSFAIDRITVLERLVASLALKAGAHPPYVKRWQEYVRGWPDNGIDATMTSESQDLQHWARHG